MHILQENGITVEPGESSHEDFLPGFSIRNGKLIVDKAKVLYAGDIVHEAAHIAVVPAAERSGLNGASIAARPHREAEEMCAIAWSYAAAVHLKLSANFVFHDGGYKGGGNNLAENFAAGHFIGLPMLQWIGLALDQKNAEELGVLPYPEMVKWLRD